MDPWAAAAAPQLQPPPSSPATTSTSTSTTTNYPTSPKATGKDQSILLLEKYRLDKYLGRGSFAKVYRGRNINDDSAVAIKIIDKSKIDAFMEPRILREVAAMRRLNHTHILKIHEVMATKSKIFLVMELATGGDLFEKLASRPGHRFPEQIARRYFQQLISALHYCHQNGVAHRDMKPQNILLDKEGNLKVCDFGLSAVADQQEVRNRLLLTACGTPAFSAPEVVARRGYDGPKADAWSCGVILFVMLSGFLPFDDANLAVMYRKMYKREIRFPSWLSKAAKSLIHQLLDPNPKTRLSIESIIQSSWLKAGQFGHRCLSLGDLVSLNERKFERAPSMNAFDIINMSSGLDLSGLFEGGAADTGSPTSEGSSKSMKEKRFTTRESVGKVVEKVVEVGGSLGYEVEKGKGSGKIWLGKGKLLLIVEALEVAPELLMVEVKVVDGGDVVFEELQWGELKSGLGDIVSSWQQDDCKYVDGMN